MRMINYMSNFNLDELLVSMRQSILLIFWDRLAINPRFKISIGYTTARNIYYMSAPNPLNFLHSTRLYSNS